MRIVVTGCSGLIGSALCERLLEEGHDIKGYDLQEGWMLESRGLVGKFPVTKGDISSIYTLQAAMYQADAVYHLAAISGVEASRQDGPKSLEVNVQGTWTVLEACRRQRIPRVVTAASNHIYGPQPQYPVKEYAAMNQLDTYSVSKICADYIARMYAHNYELPVVIIRNTNCYGPHDPHDDHLIPGTIKSLLAGRSPEIRGDGMTKKAYLYIDDVVDAYLAALDLGLTKGGEAYNISGMNHSVLEVVTTIQRMMGMKIPAVVKNIPNDQSHENLDCTKFHKATGWTPKVSLELGINKTVEWMKKKVAV